VVISYGEVKDVRKRCERNDGVTGWSIIVIVNEAQAALETTMGTAPIRTSTQPTVEDKSSSRAKIVATWRKLKIDADNVETVSARQ